MVTKIARRACIFGASGGIGRALVTRLAGSGEDILVYAGSRDGRGFPLPSVSAFACDPCDEPSIAAAAAAIGAAGALDLVIVATGILHREGAFGPEKSLRSLNPQVMAEVLAINTIAPAIIAKHFLPLLHTDRRVVFAALSARVGSISDNRLGGWHSYRASKAALNMLVQNFAIELRRTNPHAIAVSLHPGTVDTGLSQPFQRNLPADQLVSAQQSAAHLIDVLNSLTPEDSGGLFAWDGARLPF